MNKKYIVRLSDEERGMCQGIVKRLKGTSEKVKRAQIMLKADADGPGWPDAKIAEAYDCSVRTVENLRERLVTAGFDAALERKRHATSPTPRTLGVRLFNALESDVGDFSSHEVPRHSRSRRGCSIRPFPRVARLRPLGIDLERPSAPITPRSSPERFATTSAGCELRTATATHRASAPDRAAKTAGSPAPASTGRRSAR
jgi:Homeodomain-like domain